MVSHLHTETRQIRRPSTSKQQQTHHSNPLCIPQSVENQYLTPVLTAIDIETGLCSATLVPNKATMMDYCVNNIVAFIMETGQRTIPQSTGANSSIKSTRHLNQALTSLQLTKPRQHRETPSNAVWTSTCHQRAHQNQLWVLFLACNTQSCHGSSKTALVSSTTTSSTVMEYPATSEDGSQTTRLPYAHMRIWRQHSLHAITSHQTTSQAREQILPRHLSWKRYIIRGILQEPSEYKSNHGSTIDT